MSERKCRECGSPDVSEISYCGFHYCDDCLEAKIKEMDEEAE